MANIGAYSRHRMLEEVRSPLYTNAGDGAVPLVYTPDEQRTKILTNMTAFTAAPTGYTVTTGATTSISQHLFNGIDHMVTLTLTNFSLGTTGDAAALAIGASLISFPTGTLVNGESIVGTFSAVGNDYTNVIVFGLGTTIASGAVGVLSGTATFEAAMAGNTSGALAASGANSVIAITAPGTTGTAGRNVRLATTTPGTAVFFNAAATWTNVAVAGALTFTGTVSVRARLV